MEPQEWVEVPPGSRLQLGTVEEGATLAIRPEAGLCRGLKAFNLFQQIARELLLGLGRESLCQNAPIDLGGPGDGLDWLYPGVVKKLYSASQPWNLHRKLHRARLFAYLHEHRVSIVDVDRAVRDFEFQSAHQLLDEIDQVL